MFGSVVSDEKTGLLLTDALIFNPSKSEVKHRMEEYASYVPMERIGVDGSFDGSMVRLTKEMYKGLTYFSDGDVLMAKISPCFENGKIATACGCKNGYGFGTTEFFVFRPVKGKTTHGFITALIKSNPVNHACRLSLSGTVGQQRISSSIFTEMRIDLPKYERQVEFDQFVSAVDKLKFNLQQAIEKAKKLSARILNDALSGNE